MAPRRTTEEGRALDEQYVRAYREQPETAEEIAFSEAAVQAVFAENPWDEDAGPSRDAASSDGCLSSALTSCGPSEAAVHFALGLEV